MLTAKEIKKLRELRRLMTLESTKFAELWDDPERNPLPKCEAEVDAFIRERTRVFRETWILPVLDELLLACEAMPDGADGRAPWCAYHRTHPTVPT